MKRITNILFRATNLTHHGLEFRFSNWATIYFVPATIEPARIERDDPFIAAPKQIPASAKLSDFSLSQPVDDAGSFFIPTPAFQTGHWVVFLVRRAEDESRFSISFLCTESQDPARPRFFPPFIFSRFRGRNVRHGRGC